MSDELSDFRDKGSKLSLGLSSNDIVAAIIENIENDNSISPRRILDIGCGTGNLLKLLSKKYPEAELFGIDYSDFSDWKSVSRISFLQHDCNQDLPSSLGEFDLIISSEVIEHIENGRHFVRQIAGKLTSAGVMIVSTPNLESWRSLLSFFIRGHHVAFGEKDYPAHILPVSVYDLTNMINETSTLKVVETMFIQNGQIPKFDAKWKSYFPFLKGRRYSDNYFIKASRI